MSFKMFNNNAYNIFSDKANIKSYEEYPGISSYNNFTCVNYVHKAIYTLIKLVITVMVGLSV